MTEDNSIRYWFALIISAVFSILVALVIIALSWYLLWKLVLSRFGVIRALLQINSNDQQPAQKTTTASSSSSSPPLSTTTKQQPIRRQNIRRE